MKISFKQIMEWRKEKLEKQLFIHIKNNFPVMKPRKRETSKTKIKARIKEISYLIREWNKRIKE